MRLTLNRERVWHRREGKCEREPSGFPFAFNQTVFNLEQVENAVRAAKFYLTRERQCASGVLPFCVKKRKMHLHLTVALGIMAIFDRICDPTNTNDREDETHECIT